jgi:hypothetical protein
LRDKFPFWCGVAFNIIISPFPFLALEWLGLLGRVRAQKVYSLLLIMGWVKAFYYKLKE